MPISMTDDVIERKPLLTLADGSEPPHTDDYLGSQAAKLHVALGAESPGMEPLSSSMSAGNIDQYRRILADQDQIQKVQTQNDVLESILKSDPSAITPEVVSTVQGLTMLDMQSPDVGGIIEKKYAQKYINTTIASADNGIVDEALETDPEQSMIVMDRAENYAFKQNYLNTKLDESEKEVQNQSWPETAWNLAENMTIGNYQTYDQVGTEAELNDLPALPGKNRLEGYAFLWGLSDPDEFRGYMDRIADDLKSRNPYAYREWFQGMVSFGNDDANLNTLMTGVDIASAIPVGKLGSLLKSAVRVSAKNPAKLYEIAGALGKNLDSGMGKVIEDVQTGEFFGNIRNARDLSNSVPNLFDPERVLNGGTLMSKASYGRLKEALMENQDLAQKFLTEPNLVDRLQPEELINYKDQLSSEYKRQHPQIAKNVIDVDVGDSTDLGNVYQAKVILGQKDGNLFESQKQAESYFKRFIKGTDDYRIAQNGQGFQIEILKNVDETKFNDFQLTLNQTTPSSMSDVSNLLSAARSPVTQLSMEQRAARSVATTTKEKLDELFSAMAEPIGLLSKGELRELDDLMVINQKSQNFYPDVGEFEKAFYDRFKKAPSEKQTTAYFSYTNISDLDLVVRDLDWYKQKASAGFEDMTVNVLGDTGPIDIVFEGKVLDRLPYESQTPFRVGIVEDGKLKSTKLSTVMSEGDRKKISDYTAKGYKIVNAVNSDFKISGKYLDYVIVKDLKRDRVGVKNVDRKAGGHKIVRYPYYIKQGQVSGSEGLEFYRGDKTFWNFRSEKEANEFLTVLEEARQKLLRQDRDAVRFLRDNIPVPVNEFMKAVSDGDIDLTRPFATVRSGGRVIDTPGYQKLNLKDSSKSGHKPGDTLLGRFAGERSEADINTIRSEGNSVFRSEAAPYLSPLEAMKTASSDMISTRVLNDYKIMTARNFIREFGDVLKGSPEELRASGLSALQDPDFLDTALQTPSLARKVQKAKNVSRAFNGLMDNSSNFSRSIELYKEKLISPILSKLGPRGPQWLEEYMMSRTRDPASFFKSMAFHTKMGFWNPTQYFKQANSMVNIVSVGGTNGLRSGIMYPFMRAVTWNGKMLEAAGSKVEALGLMKGKDFVESMTLYRKSGFNEIGGDLSYLDDLRSPELVQGNVRRGVKSVMSTSAKPFYEGERMTRMSAFNTAYLEKRTAVGTRKLTRRDEADILYRAKTLIGNMTREANAPWQKGYASVFTQFFGYQARIMDQLVGKQLTGAERARLFIGYSAMYGTPVALGATAGILPVREIVVNQMNEMGMSVEGNPAGTAFVDGFVTAMTDYMFDKKWNISSSYGPGGLPSFYDVIRGDKELTDFFLGASGSIALSTLKDSAPIFGAMLSETEDFEGGLYNLTADDWLKPLRNISSVNSAAQVFQVYNFGIWASKNGFDITKMDLPDAVFAAITGLQPAEIEDAYAKLRASKSLKEEREAAKKDITNRLKDARKLEDSRTKESILKSLKAEMRDWGLDKSERRQISKYANDSETLTDFALEQYEKVIERKNSGRVSEDQ